VQCGPDLIPGIDVKELEKKKERIKGKNGQYEESQLIANGQQLVNLFKECWEYHGEPEVNW